MTMIACAMDRTPPLIIGDLLISDSVKPDKFISPTLQEDVLQYLSDDVNLHPVWLYQKIYILKSNVCIALAGNVFYIKQFLEDITIFCRATETMSMDKMNIFLKQNEGSEGWKYFSFVIFLSEIDGVDLAIGQYTHGNWQTTESEIFGKMLATGSGAEDFLTEIKQDAKLQTNFEHYSTDYSIQVNIIMLSRLIARERLDLASLKKHWGAGFEMIYFDKAEFRKIDNITYVINGGKFNENGVIQEVPAPLMVLHYKYHGEVLVITVIATYKGTTESTDSSYIINSKNFSTTEFIVLPIGYSGSTDFKGIINDHSFKSNRTAMGYIFETGNGHYLPASFHIGQALEVNYEHLENLTITMAKEVNDTLIGAANSAYEKFK